MVRVKRRGLINLDKRELLDQKWKPLSGRPFSMKQTVEVLIALMPVDLESPLMSFRPVPDTKAPFPERPRSLELLPGELIMLIMTFVENEIDCFRLAVTCQHCWAIGAHEIQRRYTAQLPCMMGDRIIHVSVELDPDDLPHSLVLTPSEREELRKPLPRWGDEVSADGFTTPLFLLAEAKFLPSPEDPKDSWIEIMQDEVPKVYWEFLHSLFQRRPFDANKLVLRNLTRAQYVHSAAYLALHEGLRTIHLGMVVLLCVSWTPYAYGPLALDTKYRGIWAGERLEVVSEELHAKKLLEEEKEWTDVGEEVMQVVTAVLQSVEMTEPEY